MIKSSCNKFGSLCLGDLLNDDNLALGFMIKYVLALFLPWYIHMLIQPLYQVEGMHAVAAI